MHHPEKAEVRARTGNRRKESVSKRRAGPAPVTLEKLVQALADTLQDVRTGKCDHLRGQAVAQLSKELSRLIVLQEAKAGGADAGDLSNLSDDEFEKQMLKIFAPTIDKEVKKRAAELLKASKPGDTKQLEAVV